MTQNILQVICGGLGTLGFALFFHVPWGASSLG